MLKAKLSILRKKEASKKRKRILVLRKKNNKHGGVYMKLSKAIRKIAAIGSGAVMLGATVMGAMAADLSSYPAPFLSDGALDSILVVGAAAASTDVLGVTDIAASLQAKMTTAVEGAEVTYVAGKGAKVYQSSTNQLNVGDNLGDVKEVFTDDDLDILAKVTFTSDNNEDYDYDQLLKLPTGAAPTIGFDDPDQDEIESDTPELHALFTSGATAYTYEISFPTMAELSYDDVTAPDDWAEIINSVFTFMDVEYTVTAATVDDTTVGTPIVKLTMMGGSTKSVLEHGETKTYTIKGTSYEVTPSIYGGTTDKAVFEITYDGTTETTKSLADGGTDTLADGTEIGISDIMTSSKESVPDSVEFYLGAQKLYLSDTDTTTQDWAGTVKLNDESQTEIACDIVTGAADTTADELDLSGIKFRYQPDDEIDVTETNKLTDALFGAFTIELDGIDPAVDSSLRDEITIAKSGSNKVKLKMTNKNGEEMNDVVLYYDATNIQFSDQTGDADDIWFVENDDATANNGYIDDGDYFIVGDGTYSHMMEVRSWDNTNKKGTLKDVASGDLVELSWTADGGTVNLIMDGITYIIDTDTAATGGDKFVVDDADGDGNSNELLNVIPLVTKKGAEIYFYDDANTQYAASGAKALTLTTGTYAINVAGGAANIVIADEGGTDDCEVYVSTDAAETIGVTGTQDVTIGDMVYILDVTEAAGNGDAACDAGEITAISLKVDNDYTDDDTKTAEGDPVIIVMEEDTEAAGTDLNYIRTISTVASSEIQLGAATFSDGSSLDQVEDTDVSEAISTYGTFVKGDTTNDKIQIYYSDEPATVGVWILPLEAVKTTVTEAVQITPMQVGVSKLDTEVTDITKQNAIIVGGPCVNTAAAAALGLTYPACGAASTIPENSAIIKLVTHANGNVALVVAGWSADDTRRASRVVAQPDVYTLSGSEMTVSGTSMTDISVATA